MNDTEHTPMQNATKAEDTLPKTQADMQTGRHTEHLKLNIGNCPSCDQEHAAIGVREFIGPAMRPYTHFYMCPVTGDPVSLMIKLSGGKLTHVDDEVASELFKAAERGEYLFAVFTQQASENGSEVMTNVFRKSLNLANPLACLKAFRENLERTFGTVPSEDDMVQVADELPPIVNVLPGASDRN